MNTRPFIIDCDTGTDDAIALICALNTPSIDLRAVTTVAGNVDLCYTAPNTLNLLRYLGSDIKVAKGSPAPIRRVLSEVRAKPDASQGEISTHGETGLGDLVLPECHQPFYEKSAVETIYEEALACKGELEIVAVGPLTNIAIALMAHPDLKDGLIKHITFMGGAAKGGNTTTVAEYNILCDPEAAHLVLQSGIPCTMVGLDVTEQAEVPDDVCDLIATFKGKGAQITSQILTFMRDRRDQHGGESTLMHDALALAAAVVPGVVECKHLFVDAECAGTYTFGHTFVAFDNRLGNFTPNCNVALKVDMNRFNDYMISCLKNEK